MGNDGSKSLTSSSSRKHSNNRSSRNRNLSNSSQGGVGGGAHTTDDIEIENSNQNNQFPKTHHRRLDKIRRSLSFRKKKNKQPSSVPSLTQPPPLTQSSATSSATNASANITNQQQLSSNSQPAATTATNTTNTNTNNQSASLTAVDTSKPTSWQDDERKVRDGTCSFHVKYLGSTEVLDSRGMHVCEQAIEKLLNIKRKPIKAILYVSGDSLRVVDESNKVKETLLVDQTIEKVSFCAPDRYHENGFAYICRDGTTRRWLCHGFMAIKDTIRNISSNSSGGERLSHAVGCAFGVCLEKKQKRERENVSMEVGPNHSFTRLGSFRQASLTERLEDPQMVIPAAEPVPIKKVDNPHAIERPKGNIDILNRQNSLRSANNPFKRNTLAYQSLKPGELPSIQQQKMNNFLNKSSVTHNTSVNASTLSNTSENTINTINELPEEHLTSPSQTDNNNNIQTNTPPQLPPMPNQQQQIPPPLPPLPQSLQQQQLINNNLSTNNTNSIQFTSNNFQQQNLTPVTTTYPLNYNNFNPSQQTFYSPVPNGNTYQQMPSTIFSTPQTPNYVYSPIILNSPPYNNSNQMHLQQQQHYSNISQQSAYMATPTTTSTHSTSISTGSGGSSNVSQQNETFEAKWARIQAAKKQTNPFAEDIAKKFEIKL